MNISGLVKSVPGEIAATLLTAAAVTSLVRTASLATTVVNRALGDVLRYIPFPALVRTVVGGCLSEPNQRKLESYYRFLSRNIFVYRNNDENYSGLVEQSLISSAFSLATVWAARHFPYNSQVVSMARNYAIRAFAWTAARI